MARTNATQKLADTLLAHAPGLMPPKRESNEVRIAKGPARIARAQMIARILRSLGKRIHKHAENECNREVSARETARDEETCETFRIVCASIGCKANLSGDPRGHCAHVVFPDGAHNTWGGAEHGWGVL